MRVGTKSLLWGYHGILWHWAFVAYAWYKLYGIPYNPKLLFCMLIHDLGYIGKKAMDSVEGKMHPILGARIIRFFFGEKWGKFCLYHSRSMSELFAEPVSKLCVADKLAGLYVPIWLFNKDELAEYKHDFRTENTDNFLSYLHMKIHEFVRDNKDIAYGPEDY